MKFRFNQTFFLRKRRLRVDWGMLKDFCYFTTRVAISIVAWIEEWNQWGISVEWQMLKSILTSECSNLTVKTIVIHSSVDFSFRNCKFKFNKVLRFWEDPRTLIWFQKCEFDDELTEVWDEFWGIPHSYNFKAWKLSECHPLNVKFC